MNPTAAGESRCSGPTDRNDLTARHVKNSEAPKDEKFGMKILSDNLTRSKMRKEKDSLKTEKLFICALYKEKCSGMMNLNVTC